MTTIPVSGETLERLSYIAGQVHMLGLAMACLNHEQGSGEGEVVVMRAYELAQQIDAVVKDLTPPMSAAEKKRLKRPGANV
jgi:hypothetical protein